MSLPDQILLLSGDLVPPVYPDFPHHLALLPTGVELADVGTAAARQAGIFLIDAECAGITLNDLAFEVYVAGKVPLLLYAQRARDLRPFLKRTEQFRRRGYSVRVW